MVEQSATPDPMAAEVPADSNAGGPDLAASIPKGTTLTLAEVAEQMPEHMREAFWSAAVEAKLIRLEREAGIITDEVTP